uniref:Glyoxylate reductase n=1 Tax=Thermomicrobium roseum TaxID=500 RepID=A0A7C5RUY4_THERO
MSGKERERTMGKDVLVLTWKYFSAREEIQRFLAERGCRFVEREIRYPVDEEQLCELVRDIDGLVVGLEPVTARVLSCANRLKVISTSGVGYDNIDVAEATRRGIVVSNCHGANEHSVAELAFGLMLSLAQHIHRSDRAMRQGRWEPYFGVELWGKTLGVVGLGRAGRAVALLGRGFGMRVLASDIVWDTTFANAHEISYVPLDKLLRESDFVSLHVPLTPETRYLIDERALALMKPTAFLINLARGPVVKQSALVEALRRGQIAGAGLDVFEVEPIRDNPFIEFENVVMTPHLGGSTQEARERTLYLALTNVCNVLNGRPPHAQVNPEVCLGW